jgi:hypothetical protein
MFSKRTRVLLSNMNTGYPKLVLDAVDKYYDQDIWQQVKEEKTPYKAAEELKKRIKEEIVPLVVKTTKKG